MNKVIGYKIQPKVITTGCLWWKKSETYWCIVELGKYYLYDHTSGYGGDHDYETIMFKSINLQDVKTQFRLYEEVLNLPVIIKSNDTPSDLEEK